MLRFTRGSVLDSGLTDRLVGRADLLIHLAAIAEPAEYGRRPKATMDTNLLGSLHVAASAARRAVPVLFASSSEVYGFNPDLPWREDAHSLFGPVEDVRWCYAASKLAAEHYLHACRRELGLRFVAVRLFNVYGPGLRGRVVDQFLRRALTGRPIEVYGDGRQVRCFTYVSDAVDALFRIVAAERFDGRTYNIGNPTPTTILELAEHVRLLVGKAPPVVFVPYQRVFDGYADVRSRIPVIARIQRDNGWNPTTDLPAGLAATHKAMRAFLEASR